LVSSCWIARLKRTEYGRWGRRRGLQDCAVWAFRDAETATEFKAHLEWVLGLSEKRAIAELKKRLSHVSMTSDTEESGCKA